MKESAFQFTTPCLVSLDYVTNDDFDKEKNGNLKFEIKSNTKIDRSKTETNQAYVELTIEIGEKSNVSPFYIKITEAAKFKWEEHDTKEEFIDELLNTNACALLVSYMRPIIANITNSSKYPAYNLPFMNFQSKEV